MEVRKISPVRAEDSYAITGLTRDEALFLRDLTGRFADNPGDNGIEDHFHTSLYVKLLTALGGHAAFDGKAQWTFSASVTGKRKMKKGHLGVLHCERAS